MKVNKRLVNEVVEGILDYLKKNNLEPMLPDVIKLLRKTQSDYTAHVSTPKKLNGKEKKSVEKLVAKLTNEKPEKIKYEIDESLIDGIKILYGDKLWDLSTAAELTNIGK